MNKAKPMIIASPYMLSVIQNITYATKFNFLATNGNECTHLALTGEFADIIHKFRKKYPDFDIKITLSAPCVDKENMDIDWLKDD